MNSSYDQLLLHLAYDYNNVLLHHTSSQSKHYNRYDCFYMNRKKRKFENEKKEDELREIEDEILFVLALRKNERSALIQSRKRGKYEKNTLFFTDPETGSRTKMTYRHSLWYQNYILNAQLDKKWWRRLFRLRFRFRLAV